MKPPPRTALLLIDVIGEFDFTGSEELLHRAIPAARRLAVLRTRLKELGLPVIYVNDQPDFGRGDFRGYLERCLRPQSPGREIARLLRPDPEDLIVIKPKSSGFHQTPLDHLLRRLGVNDLILGGFAGDMCVLHTAIDAAMRDHTLTILSDGIASESTTSNAAALSHMDGKLNARILTTDLVGR